MRLAGVLQSAILLIAILLLCSSIQAQEPGDIAIPSMNGPNMDVPAPQISPPNMDMPAPNPIPLSKPVSNPSQAPNQAGNTSFGFSSNQTQTAQTQQETDQTDVSGKWSVMFDDGTDISLDLNLWSSGENRVMGFGTLTEKGSKSSVTVSGSVADQELKLTAKPSSTVYSNSMFDEYGLDLFKINDTLSGTYVLKSGGQSVGKGNATALKQ